MLYEVITAGAVDMDRAREELLSRSSLPVDQNRDIGVRHLADLLEDPAHTSYNFV